MVIYRGPEVSVTIILGPRSEVTFWSVLSKLCRCKLYPWRKTFMGLQTFTSSPMAGSKKHFYRSKDKLILKPMSPVPAQRRKSCLKSNLSMQGFSWCSIFAMERKLGSWIVDCTLLEKDISAWRFLEYAFCRPRQTQPEIYSAWAKPLSFHSLEEIYLYPLLLQDQWWGPIGDQMTRG